MAKPLVLCSNDDGIDSPHLLALADLIAAFAEVVVVAPERQRSAASHAITLHKPLRLTERAPGRYSLSGTPVDCVYVGVIKLCGGRKPDVVVSGVNDGYNLGSDVFYSGTVAAAVEGALRGAAGIALSMNPRATDPAHAIAFGASVVRAAIAEPVPGTVLNVNMPGVTTDAYEWTTLGRRYYEDDVAERLDPRGRPYYWVGGGPTGHAEIAGTDCVAIHRGHNSITPMHLDLNDRPRITTPPWALEGFRVIVSPT
ncbi:MAG: 5'/3'-nucleotidase SurE [Proteobacteria bacterium]|nr:5'/3'-nucleotidase SurE [Pseudomonadota bacterium]